MTIKVDLLPSEKRGFGLDPVLIVLLIIVVLCVVVFYFISAWFESDIARKRDEVKQWDDKITLIKADIPKITKMREDNNRLQTQIEVIKSLSNDPERYANILYELGSILPPNMWLTSVTVDTNAYSVTIAGTAVAQGGNKPLETIAKFMTDVANHSRYFKDATLSGTTSVKNPTEGDGYTFQMELHYDPTRATKAWNVVTPGADQGTSTTPGGTVAPSTTTTPETATSASPATAASSSASPAEGASGAPSGAPASASPEAAGSEQPGSTSAPAASGSPAPGK